MDNGYELSSSNSIPIDEQYGKASWYPNSLLIDLIES